MAEHKVFPSIMFVVRDDQGEVCGLFHKGNANLVKSFFHPRSSPHTVSVSIFFSLYETDDTGDPVFAIAGGMVESSPMGKYQWEKLSSQPDIEEYVISEVDGTPPMKEVLDALNRAVEEVNRNQAPPPSPILGDPLPPGVDPTLN